MVKEVVGQVVEGLRSSPLALAVILLNAMMITGGTWFLTALAAAQQSRFDILMKACMGRMQ